MASSGRHKRIALMTASSASEADGIRDYTHRLSATLRASGLNARVVEWSRQGAPTAENGRRSPWGAADELGGADAVIVQYCPFSFGRRGFAPALPLFLGRLRRRKPRPLIAVMFHETYVDMKNFRWMLMGGWQRAQLVAIQAAADVQLCSIQRWTERLRRTSLGRPVHHLPVASNLPDGSALRSEVRRRIGAGPETVVLGCLGLRHPGRLRAHAVAAAREAGSAARSVLLLDLGPGASSVVRLTENVELRATGFLQADELAGHIAASDVFLAPYMDGVSTRRSTVMAALQHGVPVVGTRGHLTDDVLARAPELALSEPQRPQSFAAAVRRLVRDPEQRARLGTAGREFYTTTFDWPVLGQRLRSHLDV
jgi:glycosyltransferase involved in cell wall biosynthesis